MKKIITCICFLSVTGFLSAQELPKLSPLSKSEHIVGLNKITLQYSRPSVRGRVIFGELLPYGEIWRLGANETTKITCSDDLIFGGETKQTLPAGTYAIFAFPSEDLNWKIVFNTDIDQWGTGNYDEAKNIITLPIKATENQHTETLLIDINEVTTQSASIIIAWDKLKIVIPFTVNTDEAVMKNIEAAIAEGKDLDKVYYASANYFFNSKKDYDTALKYIDLSIEVKKSHSNVFLKARILYAKGETKDAIKLAEEALKMAEEAEEARWIEYITETLTEWKKK